MPAIWRSPTGSASGWARSGASPCGAMSPVPARRTSEVNADLLLVHSAAARAGHHGAARNDRRARAAARFLTGREIWHGGAHPGWWASPDVADQHLVFEAEVAEGLAAAYAARRALGLDARRSRLIRRQLAHGRREPRLALAGARDEPAQLVRAPSSPPTRPSTARAGRSPGPSRVTSRGSREASAARRRPGELRPRAALPLPAGALAARAMNFDSPEYANIVLGFSRAYGQARAAGMPRAAASSGCCGTGCGACSAATGRTPAT